MKTYDNCEICECILFDDDSQQILCRGCDGNNKFSELSPSWIDTFAEAWGVNDDYCLACEDRKNNTLPEKFRGLSNCPCCAAPWLDLTCQIENYLSAGDCNQLNY